LGIFFKSAVGEETVQISIQVLSSRVVLVRKVAIFVLEEEEARSQCAVFTFISVSIRFFLSVFGLEAV